MDKAHVAFQDWAGRRGYYLHMTNGEYTSLATLAKWECWHAAWIAATAGVVRSAGEPK